MVECVIFMEIKLQIVPLPETKTSNWKTTVLTDNIWAQETDVTWSVTWLPVYNMQSLPRFWVSEWFSDPGKYSIENKTNKRMAKNYK